MSVLLTGYLCSLIFRLGAEMVTLEEIYSLLHLPDIRLYYICSEPAGARVAAWHADVNGV